jgi:PAS domain S-box-containing protein
VSRLNRILSFRPSRTWSYGFAVVSIASAVIFSRWLTPRIGFPGTLFLCAVMLSAWFGGLGPGLLATTLSVLAFHDAFLHPIHSFGPKPPEMPRLLMYIVTNLLVGLLSAAQRGAKESLRHARDDLKHTVQDLQKTNEALHAESRDRSDAEDKLRRIESYLAEAQRLSHTGSWAYDPATQKALYWSDEMFRICGFDSQQGPPTSEMFLERVHPEDRERVDEAMRKAAAEKTEYQVEHRIILPNGTIRHTRARGHPVLNRSGNVVQFVGSAVDITDLKRAEQERERLRQVQAELTHINRVTSIGELTASLAHEVKQPIAAAITDANTCLRWLSGDQPNLVEAREAASRIVKDGKRAGEIVNRVRLLFKKDAQQWELVDLKEIIREMILLLRGEATESAVSVRAELGADLPQVNGDRVQLQQVLMNLMMNSIDAMRDVDGARELNIQSERAEDSQVLISVSDTGVGLPPQQSDKIFNAFFTTKTQGTGMGLRISRSIVESHGGRLWAADNSPRGARFCFTLPIEADAHDSDASADRMRPPGDFSPQQPEG